MDKAIVMDPIWEAVVRLITATPKGLSLVAVDVNEKGVATIENFSSFGMDLFVGQEKAEVLPDERVAFLLRVGFIEDHPPAGKDGFLQDHLAHEICAFPRRVTAGIGSGGIKGFLVVGWQLVDEVLLVDLVADFARKVKEGRHGVGG